MKRRVTMKRTTFTALVFAMVAVLSSTTAAALDTKVYHGSYCKPYFGSQVADFRFGIDGITNLSTSTRAIICPLVHDQAFGPEGAKVYVRYAAPRSGGTLSCRMYSLNADGLEVDSDPHQITVANNANAPLSRPGWLPYWDGILLPQPAFDISTDDASYTLYCNLPAGFRVSAIQIDEND